MDVSPSVAGCSTGHFDMYDMLPVTLTRSWCAIWFALTGHGGLDVVGSFDSFLIFFHALRLLCVILVDVMTSYHLFSSVILSISLFADYMWPCQKGCLNIFSCMLHIEFLIGHLDRERILFDILIQIKLYCLLIT